MTGWTLRLWLHALSQASTSIFSWKTTFTHFCVCERLLGLQSSPGNLSDVSHLLLLLPSTLPAPLFLRKGHQYFYTRKYCYCPLVSTLEQLGLAQQKMCLAEILPLNCCIQPNLPWLTHNHSLHHSPIPQIVFNIAFSTIFLMSDLFLCYK